MGDKDTSADLPFGIRDNASLKQFIAVRLVGTPLCIASFLVLGRYWPVTVVALIVASEVWLVSVPSRRGFRDPLRPISRGWKREEASSALSARIDAALDSEAWQRIERIWRKISAAACASTGLAVLAVNRLWSVSDQFPHSGWLTLAIAAGVWGTWYALVAYWHASLQGRFLKRILLANDGSLANGALRANNAGDRTRGEN